MLSNEQKEILRKIEIYEMSDEEKNGKPIIRKREPREKRGKKTFSVVETDFVIPSIFQLFDYICEQIINAGFSKIERVEPNKANCIIRVFQKLHYEYEFEQIFNIYGANCFVKRGRDWFSETNGSIFKLDYSKYIIKQWLYQDEYILFDTDYVDFYVKIS